MITTIPAGLGVCLLLMAPAPPRTRAVSVEYSGWVESARLVDFWMPAPHSDSYQTVSGLTVTSDRPYEISTDAVGNRILHVRATGPIHVTLRFNAERRERRQDFALVANRPPESPDALAQALRPDRLVPLDGQIRKWAWEVVNAAHARTDLEKARAIYNHVVATVKYDKTGKGWGRGDIYYACENRRGNCTDFHAIFIGYARAVGVPARFAIGYPLPAARGAGEVTGYHCWAEFYAQGIGWIPIDASEAAKDPARREYFFGAHDENRIEFTRGRDLTLAPPQQSAPLNYFVYPYAEADGKPLEGVGHKLTYRDQPSPQSETAASR